MLRYFRDGCYIVMKKKGGKEKEIEKGIKIVSNITKKEDSKNKTVVI